MVSEMLRKKKKGLYILAMVNVGVYALALIVLAVLLSGNGNLRGMYVILAGGVAVGVSLLAAISSLEIH